MSSPTNTERCSLLVKIDGKEEVKARDKVSDSEKPVWQLKSGAHIVSLTVDQRLDAPDAFAIQLLGTSEGQRTVFDFVKEGSKIELGFGYNEPEVIFTGEVVYCEVEYDAAEGSLVTIRGYDHSHRLTRGQSAKTWGDGLKEDQKLSDVVSEVIDKSKAEKGDGDDGLSPDKIDDTEFKSRYIPKAMTTDYDFIKWGGSVLARASDSDVKDDRKVSFRKLNINAETVATVCYEKMTGTNPIRHIRSRFQISTFPIYAKVRVHGWNAKEKKAFVGEVEKCSPEVDCSKANSGWTSAWDAVGEAHWSAGKGSIYERVSDYCENKEEAKKIAQGIFDSFSLRYNTGECEAVGSPKIVPGAVVAFSGFGDRISGKYIVTEAVHHLSAPSGRPYATTFKFCANAAKKAKT